MGRDSVRERCLTVLEQVEIPDPFDIHAFAHHVGRHRGRPVRLMAKDDIEGPCGVCISAGSEDHVFYEAGTGEFHRDHIVLHELGHLLMGHDAESFWTDEAPTLLPDLDLAVIQSRMLSRSSSHDDREREAEMIATLVQEHVSRRNRDDVLAADGLSRRLHMALGSHGGGRRHG